MGKPSLPKRHHERGDNTIERSHSIRNFLAGLTAIGIVGGGIWLLAWLLS